MNKIFAMSYKTEQFNSNNGWGFGGSSGTEYFLDGGVSVCIGSYSYRHLPSKKFIKVRKDGFDKFEYKSFNDVILERIKELQTC